jgi:hypothetical protein
VQVANELCRNGIGSWKGGKPKGASGPVVIKGKPLSQAIIEERRYSAYFLENGWNDWNGWNVWNHI